MASEALARGSNAGGSGLAWVLYLTDFISVVVEMVRFASDCFGLAVLGSGETGRRVRSLRGE